MNRTLNKRSDYFKKESVFYSQIYNILNLKNDDATFTTKQLRLEKWIIDYDNYRIKNIIDEGNIDRSSESKIYSNIFRSFDKEWNYKLSIYKINNYREMKKIYNRCLKKKNNYDIEFLSGFIVVTMGSLNIFSLIFNKILEYVYKEGGIKYNELVMKIGEHLISNFCRELKKELGGGKREGEGKIVLPCAETNISNLESVENESNRKEKSKTSTIQQKMSSSSSSWEINPLELYVKLKSSAQSEIKGDDTIINKEDRDKILEMFTNISEELKADLGNIFMIVLKNSCEELVITNIREDNKTNL